VIAKKPVAEVDSKTAAKMLGMSRARLNALIHDKVAAEILVWRWATHRRGKRLFAVESLVAYRKASGDPEFGQGN